MKNIIVIILKGQYGCCRYCSRRVTRRVTEKDATVYLEVCGNHVARAKDDINNAKEGYLP